MIVMCDENNENQGFTNKYLQNTMLFHKIIYLYLLMVVCICGL